jgi:hypothetical protein
MRLSDLVSATCKLASMQLRLNAIAVEATLALGRISSDPGEQLNPTVTDIEVDAAARAIEAKLLDGREIGFRSLLRTNFSREAILEMARAALVAAKEVQSPIPE